MAQIFVEMDLSISKGLRDDSVEEVLRECHQVVAKFHKLEKTSDLAEYSNISLHKLKVVCTTRWYSPPLHNYIGCIHVEYSI